MQHNITVPAHGEGAQYKEEWTRCYFVVRPGASSHKSSLFWLVHCTPPDFHDALYEHHICSPAMTLASLAVPMDDRCHLPPHLRPLSCDSQVCDYLLAALASGRMGQLARLETLDMHHAQVDGVSLAGFLKSTSLQTLHMPMHIQNGK